MATEYRLGCDRCAYAVTTVAPKRMADGRLLARLYCAACAEVRECVVDAKAAPVAPRGVLLGPRQGQAARLARAIAGRFDDGTVTPTAHCPDCGNGDLLLMIREGQEPPYPQCGVGRLRSHEAR